MSIIVKIAVVQMQPEFGQLAENQARVIQDIREAVQNQARLIVFPECVLSGYMFASRDEALAFAQPVPGLAIEAVTAQCRESGVYAIFGLLEKDRDKLFNSSILVGPEGIIGKYRKCHLPYLGVDRFVNAGDTPLPVFPTGIGNIGMLICYDIVFPESVRVMALKGADILALPANFPQGRGEKVINHVATARALENRVHVIVANRVGREREASFAGLSKIADVTGETLALANQDQAEIIYAELDIEAARQKHLTIVPGQYELDYWKDRRPELYGVITQPVDNSGPGHIT
jgi:predicted amidohydrolase